MEHTLDINTFILSVFHVSGPALVTNVRISVHLHPGLAGRPVKIKRNDIFPGQGKIINTLIHDDGRRNFVHRRENYRRLSGDISLMAQSHDIITCHRNIVLDIRITHGLGQVYIILTYCCDQPPVIAVADMMRNACLDIALLCDGERSRSKLVLYLNSVFLFLEITTVDIIQLIHTVAFHACMGNHLLATYIRLLLYFKLVKNGFDLDIQIINNSL